MAFIISSLIIQGIYAGLIGGISTLTIGACSAIKSIYTHKNPDINRVLTELDIERRLQLIESVLNIKEKNKKPELAKMKLNEMEKTIIFEIVKGEDSKFDDPIELCLTYLHKTIQNIHNDLLALDKKVVYHNTKWFSSWRTLNIKTQLESLRANTNLLVMRFDDLIKISNFLSETREQ